MGDRLETFSKVGDGLAGVTGVLALMVGVAAILYAGEQIAESRQNEARGYYRDFMALSIQYPEFSKPNLKALRADPVKLQQYEWFVAYMLSAFEDLYATQKGDAGWRSTIRSGLADHRDYIAGPEFANEFCGYDAGFRDEIHAATEAKAPACTLH